MRPVHFVKPTSGPYVEPICGDWGSMASDWTADAAAVTCGACLDVLRDLARGARDDAARPGESRTV